MTDTTLVNVRRGVAMVPIYDIPLDQVCCKDDSKRTVLKSELLGWLADRGLPDDPWSDLYTWWYDLEDGTASFFFLDKDIAIMFKLTWV